MAAHNLKASSSYTGAGLIHYNCYSIQTLYIDKNYTEMVSRYNRLIEDSIEFLIYVEKEIVPLFLQDLQVSCTNLKQFDVETFPLAENYQLIKC